MTSPSPWAIAWRVVVLLLLALAVCGGVAALVLDARADAEARDRVEDSMWCDMTHEYGSPAWEQCIDG
jgi:hypothetical protein